MPGEYLTVKEYAAAQNITEQAVYKQLRAGKLKTVKLEKDGRAARYILADQGPAAAAAGADPLQQPEPEPGQDPGQGAADPGPAAAAAGAADYNAALKTIETLTAQLAAKDKQIESLLTLIDQAQKLQLNTQRLLEQGKPQPQDAQPIDPDTEPAAPDLFQGAPDLPPEARSSQEKEPEKRSFRNFLKWLFG